MRAWEKAKQKFSSLSKGDFIALTCPYKLDILDCPDYCSKDSPNPTDNDCEKCWDREL